MAITVSLVALFGLVLYFLLRSHSGEGGHSYDYGDHETGEYASAEWDPCTCWNEELRWTVLPLPHLPHRRRTTAAPWATSDERPF
ncbi:hypothetical protein [Streptomyces sp. NRRL B-1322]|uniref:hypothetical protein n=1 Tax=Streptomyces sp. NRRL B-1322 TaxID=1463828 RepID=UPI000690600F|nr:hypothetical protein [Streptomyces sp. NRRL B-1322]